VRRDSGEREADTLGTIPRSISPSTLGSSCEIAQMDRISHVL
jgi:hypothetical protein